jgi:hypothetical protein
MARWLLVLAIVAPRLVRADDFDAERIPIRIAVGETREIEVGFARMHLCDDPTIVEAEMRDKTAETNVFVIKGLRPGTTDCRAGVDEDRPSFLFGITVESAPKPKAPKTPKPAPKK